MLWQCSNHTSIQKINILKPQRFGHYFTNNNFMCIFFSEESIHILIQIPQKFLPNGRLNKSGSFDNRFQFNQYCICLAGLSNCILIKLWDVSINPYLNFNCKLPKPHLKLRAMIHDYILQKFWDVISYPCLNIRSIIRIKSPNNGPWIQGVPVHWHIVTYAFICD